ncbi:MAG: tetratricopeptide repeat protein [Motiliproteus sp.]
MSAEIDNSSGVRKGGENKKRWVFLLSVVAMALLGTLIKYLPGDWTLKYRDRPEQEMVLKTRTPAEVQQVSQAEDQKALAAVDPKNWVLSPIGPQEELDDHAKGQLQQQVDILFEHSVLLLKQKSYQQARKAIEQVLVVMPDMPEAHVNLGYALLGLEQADSALQAFNRATEINPMQANAYYGIGICYELKGELHAALGAMRTFLHVGDGKGRFSRRARSAVWEWEEKLNGGPQKSDSDSKDG